MDQLSRSWYELAFERQFLRLGGDAFQDFFADIMEKRHPRAFIRVRPWGKIGDRKNDGYLRSERRLFQVYAPNEMTAASACAKIDEDFTDCLPHWRDHFDTWTFVHNSRDGLGPDVTKKLLDLGVAHSPPNVDHWGFEALRGEAMQLDQANLASLLGQCPTNDSVRRVGFADLRLILEALQDGAPVADVDLRPPPADKIVKNKLSDDVQTLLRAGMRKADLVQDLLGKLRDPTMGDRVADAFRAKYDEFKALGMSANRIFQELHIFAGGESRRGADHEAAVLAVLAYYFERCDIFEREVTNGAAPN